MKSIKKYVFGIDIGGTTTKFGLFTEDGTLIEKFAIDTDITNEGTNILSNIAEAIFIKLEEKLLTISDIAGVGVGIPGPVNCEGIALLGPNINWIKPVAVAEILSNLLGIPVKVTNDANIASLGEIWLGAAKDVRTAIMFTLGTGVGGGIVVDGKIIDGTNGAGGEIGHIAVVYEDGAQCGCGKTGCLETVASATGIVRMAKKHLSETDIATSLRNIENLQAKDVFHAAKLGDIFALEIVDRVGYYLGIAAANLAVTIDPDQFIFGGGVANAGDILLNAIRKYYEKYSFSSVKNTPFLMATLGNDAGIIGGAYLAIH
ncbi:MAG: ROK family glucokinase [Defluviitaleaceae bacterium]|nr:ROK family glucokinase [Defluviitaleaceae bacterium]